MTRESSIANELYKIMGCVRWSLDAGLVHITYISQHITLYILMDKVLATLCG